MNERIRELFKQAGGKTSVRNLMSNPVQNVETHELWDEHINKFAELIVQECARQVSNLMDYTDYVDRPDLVQVELVTLMHARHVIKEHFGIK